MGKGTVVIAGSVAQKPDHGGHTWVFLQYLLGFRALGWDVLLIDSLDPAQCRDSVGRPCPVESSRQARRLHDVVRHFGLDEAFSILNQRTGETLGLERRELLKRVGESTLFVNFNGYIQDQEVLERAPCKAFLDLDPGFLQFWDHLEMVDPFPRHDAYFTVGQNLGHPECSIPSCGIEWIATEPPVFLDFWPAVESFCRPFTSVCTWRGAFAPVRYNERTLGLRAHEFRRFIDLPRRSQLPFELALDIHPTERRDLELLRLNGWRLVSPRVAAGDPSLYREYIQSSKAEFSVAKNMYVETQSGWLSDRTVCYLASGKPCVVQDTGFNAHCPTSKGLISFSTMGEALECVQQVWKDYKDHCTAAREIAVGHYSSERILARLLEKAGVN
jgi:hypothetical protein